MIESLETFTAWQLCDGVDKDWTYDFKLFQLTDCFLEYKATEDGAVSVITTNMQFFPGLNYDGGYIRYPQSGSALASGFIRVVRLVPYEQKTQIGLEGTFNPEIHERAFDRLTMQTQQLASDFNRSWKVARGSTGGEIEVLADGHFPVFDNSGNMRDGGDASDLAALQAIAEGAAAALQEVTDLIEGLTPFGAFETTVEAGSTDSVDTGNADLNDKFQVDLTIDSAAWPWSAFTVLNGVISPVGTWPGNNGDPDLAVAVGYRPMTHSTVGVSTVPDNSVSSVKLISILRRAISVTPLDYNAVDGGVIPTQSQLQAWLSAAIAEKREALVPAGTTFLSNAQLDLSAGGIEIRALTGSKILFGNAASGGFKFQPSGALNPEMRLKIDGLRIGAKAVISRAIEIILPNDGDFTNETQIDLQNIRIKGVAGTGGYFTTALRERNVGYTQVRNMLYWGSTENAAADSGYYAGTMFDIDTQSIADDPIQGLTLECLYESCHGHFINTGLKVRNFCEGIMLQNSSFVARRGVDASSPAPSTRQPSLRILNNHFAVAEWGIKSERIFKSRYYGNEIYRAMDKQDLTWKGIWIIDGYQNQIGGGGFIMAETQAPSAAAAIGIVVEGTDSSASWDCQISDTVIGGAAADPTYKIMSAGIQINNTQNNIKIHPSVNFSGVMTEQIDDNSGTLTNGLHTGVTLAEGGVPVSKVGKLAQLDLAAADFTTAPTPAKDVVAVAITP